MRLLRILVRAALVLVLWSPALTAQELPLKRIPAPLPPGPCELALEGMGLASTPTAADATEAARLGAEAGQAAILGDNVRARAFLREAVRLDPTSAGLRYRLARLLEDTGDGEEALAEYCRYLAVTPDGPEAAEVSGRMSTNPTFAERAVATEANEALLSGVSAYDRGDFEGAAREFTRALLLRPDWEEAHYNRAIAYFGTGRDPAAAADLEWYLELVPEAADRGQVEARLLALQPTLAPTYSPSTALVTGMLLPGMGHFYSGRPRTGILVLAAAGGAAAAAFLYREVEVQCLSLPVNGACPAGQTFGEEASRPFLAAGLGAAAVVTVAGALHAYFRLRGQETPSTALRSDGGFTLGRKVAGLTPFFMFEPHRSRDQTRLRAGAELRF